MMIAILGFFAHTVFVGSKGEFYSLFPSGYRITDNGIQFGEIFIKIPKAKPLGKKDGGKVYKFSDKGINVLSAHKTLVYPNVWKNVDIHILGTDRGLALQFVVKPGGKPEDIRLEFPEAEVRVEREGILVNRGNTVLKIEKPRAFVGSREIEIKPVVKGNTLTYRVEEYDRNKTLVIDPVVAIILASSGDDDFVYSIKVNPYGEIYIGGQISDPSTYIDTNVYHFGTSGNPDAFISKFTLYGHQATAIISSPATDELSEITFDDAGNVYASGSTKDANNFGPTRIIYGTVSPGEKDVFVVKLSPDLSTFYGAVILASSGKDEGHSLKIGYDGTVFVVGQAGNGNDFVCNSCPEKVFIGDSRGNVEAFVSKINPNTGAHIKTVLLTSDAENEAYDIDFDSNNYVFVVGRTRNYGDFGCSHEYYGGQPSIKFGYSAFVARLDYDLNCYRVGILASEIVSDVARAVVVGYDGSVFAGGLTEDPSTFPKSPKYYYGESDDQDAFIVKLSNNLRNHHATAMLSSLGKDKIYDLAIDPTNNNIIAVGETEGTNSFAPDSERVILGTAGNTEAFISRLVYDLSDHVVSYLVVSPGNDIAYAVDVDDIGRIYAGGETADPNNFAPSRSIYGTVGGVRDGFALLIDNTSTEVSEGEKADNTFAIYGKTLRFKLTKAIYVGFDIYQTSGKLVKSFSFGILHPGEYKKVLELPRGIYILRVRLGDRIIYRKAILR